MTSDAFPIRPFGRKHIRLQRVVSAASLLILQAGLLLLLGSRAQAQQQNAYCGSKDYLSKLPVKPPQSTGIKRQIQLVNCSDKVLLGAANAAHAANKLPWPVFPQEETWVMQPFNPSKPTDYSNVLTIDVPPQWYGQFEAGGVAPNFWARTGCRYDEVANRAECETGGCSTQYDCSSGNISPPPGTAIVEWTFYQKFVVGGKTYYIDSPDISAVNGANLTVDVSPRGGSARDPRSSENFHWLNWNYPLTVHGEDLREADYCTGANVGKFKVTRADVPITPNQAHPGYPLLGYVIVDGNGTPTMPSGNYTLACLSNCGYYKFPLEVGKPGCNPRTDANCYYWDVFCAGDEGIQYHQRCFTDQDCLQYNGGVNYHIACHRQAGLDPDKPGACELRGFFKGTVAQCNGQAGTQCGSGEQCAAPTSTIACTNTWGSINPLDDNPATNRDWADQPIVGNCNDVVFAGNGKRAACIGEDTLHQVLHGAYTWPNDPQVYPSNAPVYRIVFSPEGRGTAPITGAQALPPCDDLPSNYKPVANRDHCTEINIDGQNSFFGIAIVQNAGSQKWQSTGIDWPCGPIPQRADAVEGVLCYWTPPPADYNCLAPKTDSTYVTNSACGRIDYGTSLVSTSMTPGNGDPLFVEVSIPSVLNTVSLPSIRGCGASWMRVASKTINTNEGVIAWYRGTSNTGSACQVTVTLTASNPAEVKVYDVPNAGAMETMSSASGTYTDQPYPYTVSAGVATTRNPNDLQLGAVLQVNQTPTPVTYWDTWLSNGSLGNSEYLQCLDGNKDCPRDDGTDWLPGHGPYSANSDVGHNPVAAGMQYFHRDAGLIEDQSSFSWAGLAIYIQLTN